MEDGDSSDGLTGQDTQPSLYPFPNLSVGPDCLNSSLMLISFNT